MLPLVDLIALPSALWFAFALRLGTLEPAVGAFWPMFVMAPLCCIPVFQQLGLYRAVLRYADLRTAQIAAIGVTVGTVMLALTAWIGEYFGNGYPRSVPVIFWMIALLHVAFTRFLARSAYSLLVTRGRERVLIYGCNDTGRHLATALAASPTLRPVGFIDDSAELSGRVVAGVRVRHSRELQGLIENGRVDRVLLALPDLSRDRRRRIVEQLATTGVHVQTVPSVSELLDAENPLGFREIDVEDLLGRDRVAPDPNLLAACVTGRTVLVTGAGGSIGSELCRQIADLKPNRLILLERSEIALFEVRRSLRGHLDADRIEEVLGSVLEASLLKRVFSGRQIDTVYHCAAYKHVPLVEDNPVAGLRNNVLGTAAVAEAAMQHRVSTLVLISTDKAVRPTSVMGASKRLAELLVQALTADAAMTVAVVRFGNVLGSSGSVVPLFQEQIERGGPVEITDVNATRYFMSIGEAAELVIQAGAMASESREAGSLFVLEMGEPARIHDLALKMIALLGKRVANGDGEGVPIEVTGLRPGEKLHEELLINNDAVATNHPRIRRAAEPALDLAVATRMRTELEAALQSGDAAAALTICSQYVEGYVFEERAAAASS